MLVVINVNHSVLNRLCKYVGNNDTIIKYNIILFPNDIIILQYIYR